MRALASRLCGGNKYRNKAYYYTMKKLFIAALLLFFGTSKFTFSQDEAVTDALENDTLVVIPDNPITANLDKLIHLNMFEANKPDFNADSLNVYGFEPGEVPVYSDSVYKARLEILDAETPFSLIYNEEVQKWINLYATRKQKFTSRLLGLAYTYYPLFEEVLDKYDLPLELKHLAIVESALNATARSRSGAVGLWQFMYRTGKIYGLEATSYIDERRDPYLSTIAACEYFTFLYGIFGNWELALASYNAGPGTISRAIRKADGKTNYWELWPYLPRETRGYVPAFIAVNYVMNHAAEHNIYPVYPKTTYFEFDTVHVKEAVTFEQISAVLNIPVEQLEYLNPSYKKNVIPATGKKHILCLPHDKIGLFFTNEETVYNYNKPPEDTTETGLVVKEVRKSHIVRKGQYLGYIAKKYGCRVSDIKDWNGLRSTRIHPGQRLIVYESVNAAAHKQAVAKKQEQTKKRQKMIVQTSGKLVYYTIQKGDTLWDIARDRGTTVSKIKQLNKTLNDKRLKPGTKILVSSNP